MRTRALVVLALLVIWMPGSMRVEGDPPVLEAGGVARDRVAPVADVSESYGRLPLAFEENRGQVHEDVRFIARGEGAVLFLTPREAVFGLESSALRMRLSGADDSSAMEGEDPLPGRVNYLRGNDPAKWRTDVPTFAAVRCREVLPGVDLVYYGNQRQLEYDVVVSPGTEPAALTLEFEGAEEMSIDPAGDLVFRIAGGEVRQKAPVAYQERDGIREPVRAGYVARGPDRVGFEVGPYDTGRPLVIDPVVIYSTYLGGSGDEEGTGIAVDSAGHAYVVGYSWSTDYPTEAAYDDSGDVQGDVVVTKFAVSGRSLVYSTYLGGSGPDQGNSIAVDADGQAYLVGFAGAADFPTTTGPFGNLGTAGAAFITKLTAAGDGLVYSALLGGGNQGVACFDIALDSDGRAYLTGWTQAPDFPLTANALESSPQGFDDGFFTIVESDGSSLVYSTLLGGTSHELPWGIALDSQGRAYLAGYSGSAAMTGSQATLRARGAGSNDVFVMRLEAQGGLDDWAVDYFSWLGGDGTNIAYDVAVDETSAAYVVGNTGSVGGFTTANALYPDHNGGWSDAYVAKIEPGGTAFDYVTYLGGESDEYAMNVAIDSAGDILVAGFTRSSVGFPQVDPVQSGMGTASQSSFVSKISAAGDALLFSTYFGNIGYCSAYAVAADPGGGVYVTGMVDLGTVPLVNSFDETLGGTRDAFVAKLQFGIPTALFLTFDEADKTRYADLAETTASWNGTIPQALAAVYTPPDGRTSKGQTVWIDLGDGAALLPFRIDQWMAEMYNDAVYVHVQMAVEDPANPGTPDLSAMDLNDSDGDGETDDTLDPSTLSEWTRPWEQLSLNGLGYRFVRIRFRFELDANQQIDHPLPYVDFYRLLYLSQDPPPPPTAPTVELVMNDDTLALATSDDFLTIDWAHLKQLKFDVVGADVNAGDTVTVTGSGIPSGASWTDPAPGNPTVAATFDWTPTTADLQTNGGVHSFSFAASSGSDLTTLTVTVTLKNDGDGDGLPDLWETGPIWHEGAELNLASLGADPNVKDIFVEIDWVTGHAPLASAIDLVVESFRHAPERIEVHVFVSDELTLGEFPDLSDGLGQNPDRDTFDWKGTEASPSEFALIKASKFTPGRSPAFHYCVFCDTLGSDGTRSGLSRGAPESDFIVALGGDFPEDVPLLDAQAGTFMHELGHNLGLDHGGPVSLAGDLSDLNRKPNYLSVMNYIFQFGLVRQGYTYGDRELYDLSRFVLPQLDETNLIEADGLTGGLYMAEVDGYGTRWHWSGLEQQWPDPLTDVHDPIDWDGDAGTPVSKGDVNKDPHPKYVPMPPPGHWEYEGGPLQSYEDWSHLKFTGGQVGAAGVTLPQPRYSTIKCLPLEEAVELFPAPPGPQTPPVPEADTETGQSEYVATGADGAVVTLTAAGSSDPDGDPITYWWYEDGALLGSGATFTASYLPGAHTVSLYVEDRRYREGPVDVSFTVVSDEGAPVIEEVSADPAVLWPPNNKMVEVAVTVVATDDHDPAPTSEIVKVTCDEPSDGDVSVTGALTVKLRAERDGKGDGRLYTIHMSCTDSAGNVTTGTVDVTVPHDQGKHGGKCEEKDKDKGKDKGAGAPPPAPSSSGGGSAPKVASEGSATPTPKVAPEGSATPTPKVAPEGCAAPEGSGSSGGGGTPIEPGTLEGGSVLGDPPSDPTKEEDEFGTEPVDPEKSNGELDKNKGAELEKK